MEIRKIQKKTPKIALLVDAWFPLYGGGQVHVAELARMLCTQHSYEVDVLTRNISGKASAFEKELTQIPGLRLIRFGFKSRFGNPFMRIFYILASFFYLVFKGKNYRAVHAHDVSSAIAMRMASWFNRVPTVVTVHGSTLFQKGFWVKRFLERVVFLESKYAKEISVSENFLKLKNVNPAVSVIGNGIDLERFDKIPVEKSNDVFDLLFVGRLDYVKGLDVLLNAYKKVLDSNEVLQSQKNVLLHIVGDGAERGALERLVKKLELDRFVKFHGKLTGDALVEAYKSSDLFVLPSRSEGFPLSLLEACAAKLPIICTDVGDNRKLVHEKINGYVIAPEDVEELAYYLELFILNPGLQQMGEKGYELVAAEYSWAAVTEKMLRIYESVVRSDANDSAGWTSRFWSLFKDKRMPWRALPLWIDRRRYNVKYQGRSSLKFCLTVDVEQAYGSADLPHEEDHVPVFLERFTEMTGALEISSTFFTQADLLQPFGDLFRALEEKGHEIGIHGLHHELWGKPQWFIKDSYVPVPERKKILRTIQEIVRELGLNVRAFRAPNLVIDKDSLKCIREAGFEIDSSAAVMLGMKPLPSIKNGLCRVPVSRDPMPHFQMRYGLRFGNFMVMNLANFLKWSDEELIEAVNRLREYHRVNKVMPHLVFLCHSWEFQSRDSADYASGGNYTQLSKKIALLKEHMEVEFKTLTELCTELYATH